MNFVEEFFLLISIPLGIGFFLSLSMNLRTYTHVKSFTQLLRYFLWPYPPRRMLILAKSDEENYALFYDGEIKYNVLDGTFWATTKYGSERGLMWIKGRSPFDFANIVSTFDAKAPIGIPSPFGLSWRWLMSASVVWFMIYVAFLQVVFNQVDTTSEIVGIVAFILVLIWLLINLARFRDKNIQYAELVSVSVIGRTRVYVPPPFPYSSLKLDDLLGMFGYPRITVELPERLKELEQRWMSEVAYREVTEKELSSVYENMLQAKKAGEIKARILGVKVGEDIKKIGIPLVIVIALAMLGIGWWLGSSFGVSVAPAHLTNTSTVIGHVINSSVTKP
ncbi:hypothetical protein [Sulfolobus super-elliptical virus]|nr:hypothetical protein [Sulfolobus super-elliptical virus]